MDCPCLVLLPRSLILPPERPPDGTILEVCPGADLRYVCERVSLAQLDASTLYDDGHDNHLDTLPDNIHSLPPSPEQGLEDR